MKMAFNFNSSLAKIAALCQQGGVIRCNEFGAVHIHGPFLFGATEKLSEATVDVESLSAVVILRLRNMTPPAN
jgi:hypothetical protein